MDNMSDVEMSHVWGNGKLDGLAVKFFYFQHDFVLTVIILFELLLKLVQCMLVKRLDDDCNG